MKLYITTIAAASILAGCAAPSSSFQNANGQVYECSASGYGILGAPAALLSHSECERKAQEAGYRPVNAASVNQTKRASNPTSIKVDWPSGWVARDITEQQSKDGVVHFGLNKTSDLGAQISVISSDGIVDRMAYASSRRANQMGRLANAKGSEIVNTTVNGLDALRFEVTGNLPSGLAVTYAVTIIPGKEHIVYVNTWTTTPNFYPHRDELLRLASRVTGIQ